MGTRTGTISVTTGGGGAPTGFGAAGTLGIGAVAQQGPQVVLQQSQGQEEQGPLWAEQGSWVEHCPSLKEPPAQEPQGVAAGTADSGSTGTGAGSVPQQPTLPLWGS